MNTRILCALLIALTSPLGAQIGRRPQVRSGPNYWVGLSYGLLEGMTLTDDASSTRWQFRYSSQLLATFEKDLDVGASVGVSAGFSNARLTYSGLSFNNSCGVQCEATADITQYLLFVRGGRPGIGFHSNFTLEGGITQFGKFREQATGTDLPPTKSTNDFTFGFGAGFGFGLSQISEIYVSEQFDFVMHPQSTAATSQFAPRTMIFRAGFRLGF